MDESALKRQEERWAPLVVRASLAESPLGLLEQLHHHSHVEIIPKLLGSVWVRYFEDGDRTRFLANSTLSIADSQGTLPPDPRHLYKRMWSGMTSSHVVIAVCMFPLALGGYWAFGSKIPFANW